MRSAEISRDQTVEVAGPRWGRFRRCSLRWDPRWDRRFPRRLALVGAIVGTKDSGSWTTGIVGFAALGQSSFVPELSANTMHHREAPQ